MDQAAKRRLTRVLSIFLLSAAGLAILIGFIRPPCLILHTTGFYCAGCGAQRMIYSVLRGDLRQAFRYNPFLFVSTPFLLAYLLTEAIRYVRGKKPLWNSRPARIILLLYALLAVLFMALRNLPAFAFLAP